MTNKEVYDIIQEHKEITQEFIKEQKKINEMVVRHDEKIKRQDNMIKCHNNKFKLIWASIFGSGGFIVISITILKFLKIL